MSEKTPTVIICFNNHSYVKMMVQQLEAIPDVEIGRAAYLLTITWTNYSSWKIIVMNVNIRYDEKSYLIDLFNHKRTKDIKWLVEENV